MKGGPRCVLYLRTGDGHPTLEDQVDFLRFWARREALEVLGTFRDDDHLSLLGDRPELAKLLGRAHSHADFDAVLVQHSDRISPDRIAVLKTHREFREDGVLLRYGNFDADPLVSKRLFFAFLGQPEATRHTHRSQSRTRSVTIHAKISKGLAWGPGPKFFRVVDDDGDRRLVPTDQAYEILRLHETGLSFAAIAVRFRISKSTIYRNFQALKRYSAKAEDRDRSG